MATQAMVSPVRARRAVTQMLAGQRMADAEPTEADTDIARRQAAGELTGDEAVAEAIAVARASSRNA